MINKNKNSECIDTDIIINELKYLINSNKDMMKEYVECPDGTDKKLQGWVDCCKFLIDYIKEIPNDRL
tara:strand:+ start:540 stop:743 length:204 start_codon:yes stop_codon:yes gene_type:complete